MQLQHFPHILPCSPLKFLQNIMHMTEEHTALTGLRLCMMCLTPRRLLDWIEVLSLLKVDMLCGATCLWA